MVIDSYPPGLGEPDLVKLDCNLAKALMGIGAVKGVNEMNWTVKDIVNDGRVSLMCRLRNLTLRRYSLGWWVLRISNNLNSGFDKVFNHFNKLIQVISFFFKMHIYPVIIHFSISVYKEIPEADHIL